MRHEDKNHYQTLQKAAFALFFLTFINLACSKSDDNHPEEPDGRFTSGLLYYSAANTLTQFDFSTRHETPVFLEGDTYSISLNGQQFAWYENDFSEGSTNVDGSTQDCGELRIVPSTPDAVIEVPDNGYDNAPVTPLQPVNEQGKVIHSCGSANIIWHSAG